MSDSSNLSLILSFSSITSSIVKTCMMPGISIFDASQVEVPGSWLVTWEIHTLKMLAIIRFTMYYQFY